MKKQEKPIRLNMLSLVTLALLAAIPIGCASTIHVRSAPPPLPVYEQPFCPGPGYLWVPGYWGYGPYGYYWVPGAWEFAPRMGWLWTPGYWGWSERAYYWHSGYWGPHIGFYGGINYGYGYTGVGYEGGYWREREFYYNRAVTKVNITVVHNTYESPALNKTVAATPVSYTGGSGGIAARPTTAELAAAHDPHIAVTPHQKELVKAAGTNRELLASENHGQPRAELLTKREAVVPEKGNKLHPKKKMPRRHWFRRREQPKHVD